MILSRSGAQAALEEKYPNVEKLLAPLNDRALEAFQRGLPDSISGSGEARNSSSLDNGLKVTLKYEARQQFNSQCPTNPYHESRYSHPPRYCDLFDHNRSAHVRFITSAHPYEAYDVKSNRISDTQEFSDFPCNHIISATVYKVIVFIKKCFFSGFREKIYPIN